jgi:curved DNA-binding protein CbpA
MQMKLDSKYFDSIRVSRSRARGRADPQASAPCCQWPNCTKRGLHRAPKERAAEGEYYHFCRDHVAAYNKSYNYFAGMNDGEITDFQKSAATGHRPTWRAGVHGTDPGTFDALRRGAAGETIQDPLDVLKTIRAKAAYAEERQPQKPARVIHKGARKHLLALNLDGHATAEEIRTQFKALVKLHHPDHNGGDRGSEERFREVIDAYNYLKQAGLC